MRDRIRTWFKTWLPFKPPDPLTSDRELKTLFARVPVGLYRTSPEGQILEANPALIELLGYPNSDSLLRVNAQDLFVDSSVFQKGLEKCRQGDGNLNIETRIKKMDGRTFWVSNSTAIVYDSRGEIFCYEGCLIDIDQRKQTEEQNRQRADLFSRLFTTAQELASYHDPHTLLVSIVDHAMDLVKASGGCIFLYDSKSEILTVEVSKEMQGIDEGSSLKIKEGLAGYVAHTREALIVDDYQNWEHRSGQFEGVPIYGVLGVPMLSDGSLIGVLLVHQPEVNQHKFTEEDIYLLKLLASQASIAVNNSRLYNDARKRLDQIEALRNIDRIMSANTDMRLALNATLSEAARQLNISALDILTVNPYKHILEYTAGLGFNAPGVDKFTISLNDNPYQEMIEGRQTVEIHNLPENGKVILETRQLQLETFNCYLGIPLIIKGQVVGILEAFDRDHHERDDEWREFLETLSQQAAIAIDNANLFEDLARSNTELSIAYETTLEGWSRALDLRDQETEGHTRRVTQMTVSLASFLGIKNYELLHIRRGALLHDIGKMGIPDEILLKPGPFTENEWNWMHKHPTFAYEMLYPIRYLHPALDIPYCHHEKWDGSGYPRGLKGKDIPLAARIFSVVDVWDAMTSNRPYRNALPRAEANRYLRESAGTHFDPEAVQAFFKFYGEI